MTQLQQKAAKHNDEAANTALYSKGHLFVMSGYWHSSFRHWPVTRAFPSDIRRTLRTFIVVHKKIWLQKATNNKIWTKEKSIVLNFSTIVSGCTNLFIYFFKVNIIHYKINNTLTFFSLSYKSSRFFIYKYKWIWQ